MNRLDALLPLALLLTACGGDDNGGGGPGDASNGDATHDAAPQNDAPSDSPPADSGTDVAVDSPGGDGGGDGGDGGCATAWLMAPMVDPSIAVPDGGATAIFHAAATGTQNYQCQAVTVDGGTTYAWVFTGPQADLHDCNATLVGHHFASDGGAAAPEWQTLDGTYVIAKKLHAFTPDGGAGSVPWLLLQETSHGGTGTIGATQYIQRVNTNGGVAPAAMTCDSATVGQTQAVAYGADYFFF